MSVLGTLFEVNICVSQRAETKSLDPWELLPALPRFRNLLGCLFPLGPCPWGLLQVLVLGVQNLSY